METPELEARSAESSAPRSQSIEDSQMVIAGNMSFHLSAATDIEGSPEGLFEGIANVVTQGSWALREKQERFELLQFTEAIAKILDEMGITDLLRISLANTALYEKRRHGLDSLDQAKANLRHIVDRRHDAEEHLAFDLVYRYEDESMICVIRFEFVRRHANRQFPLTIRVTGVQRDMQRGPEETNDAYVLRVRGVPLSVASAQAHVSQLMDRLRDGISKQLIGHSVKMEVTRKVIGGREPDDLRVYTEFPGMLYGFSALYDLSYIWLLPELRKLHELKQRDRDHRKMVVGSYLVDFPHFPSTSKSDGGWFDSSTGGIDLGGGGFGDFFSGDGGGFGGGCDGGGGDGGGGCDGWWWGRLMGTALLE